MINKKYILFPLLILFFVILPTVVNAGGGSDCLVSYHDICKNDDGLCKQEWVSGCDYCEVDNIEYSCELPSGGGSASCGIAEKCIITLPPPPSDCVDVGSESFVGCYLDLYSDPSLPLKRTDPIINFDWGEDSPDESLYSDYFSVKWEGDFTFPTTGFYTFYIATDDGVRIYVDGELVFDRWYDQSAVLVEEQVFVYSGVRRIKVEYYEKGGDAEAHFGWELEQAINEPNRPSISGDLTTLINSNYLFQIHSTDPQGYNIRYGLDWSNPLDDIVDDWIPSTGYLSSGTYQDASHVFPVVGEVSFAVLAQNEWGLNSDWRYKDILVYHPEPILEATPSSVDLGDVVSVSFSAERIFIGSFPANSELQKYKSRSDTSLKLSLLIILLLFKSNAQQFMFTSPIKVNSSILLSSIKPTWTCLPLIKTFKTPTSLLIENFPSTNLSSVVSE